MSLRLPTWQELSKDEQIPIINLPMNNNYVVIGGPGTGKTIMALHRAAKWKDAIEKPEGKEVDHKILILVFNKTLSQYLKVALETIGLGESSARTWHSWFYNFYRKKIGSSVPELDSYKPDWEIVSKEFQKVPDEKIIEHLILDEAQDFPRELLEVLNKFSNKVTVFGDPHQAIINNKTTTVDFTHAFGAGGRVYHLSKNYRNTIEIAEIANLFYSGDSDDIPAVSKNNGPKPTFYQCNSYDKCIDLISNYADNNPSEMIGVLIPAGTGVHTIIRKYAKDIQDKTSTSVQHYTYNKQNNPFEFESDGVKVMSYSTAKGLEFDTLFLPEINHPNLDKPNDFLTLNSIYVASSRAKTNLTYISLDDYPDNFVTLLLKKNKELLIWKDYK